MNGIQLDELPNTSSQTKSGIKQVFMKHFYSSPTMILVFITPVFLYFLFLDYLLVTNMRVTVVYCLFFTLVFAAEGMFLSEMRAFLIAIVLLWVFAVSVYWADYSPRKPFFKDIRRIQIGMKTSEVGSIMSGYIRSSGNQYNPDEHKFFNYKRVQTVAYSHTNDGRWDSDVVIITLSDDTVINILVLPD